MRQFCAWRRRERCARQTPCRAEVAAADLPTPAGTWPERIGYQPPRIVLSELPRALHRLERAVHAERRRAHRSLFPGRQRRRPRRHYWAPRRESPGAHREPRADGVRAIGVVALRIVKTWFNASGGGCLPWSTAETTARAWTPTNRDLVLGELDGRSPRAAVRAAALAGGGCAERARAAPTSAGRSAAAAAAEGDCAGVARPAAAAAGRLGRWRQPPRRKRRTVRSGRSAVASMPRPLAEVLPAAASARPSLAQLLRRAVRAAARLHYFRNNICISLTSRVRAPPQFR